MRRNLDAMICVIYEVIDNMTVYSVTAYILEE